MRLPSYLSAALWAIGLSSTCGPVCVAVAAAPETAERSSSAGEASTEIEEIVVTAQKREQNLQDVPIAITAITQEQIEARGITSLFDLGSAAPNLHISKMVESSTATPQIGIRGRTQYNPTMHLSQPVGLYIDGVYLGAPVGAALDLVELERIEVLRGPQGTLFGRNTLAGAVNFITRKPSGEFSGSASIDIGNYNSKIYNLNMDLPTVGIASISMAGRVERRDGWRDLAPGGPVNEAGGRHNQAARVAALFDISDDLNALYAFDISDYDQTVAAANLYHTNPTFWEAVGLPEFNDYVSTERDGTFPAPNNASREEVRVTGHAFTVTWDVSDNHTIKSVTSFRKVRDSLQQDWDKTPLSVAEQDPLGQYPYPGEMEQWSQEFQLIGSTERLNYVGGLFYYQNEEIGGADRAFFCATVFGCVYSRDWSLSKRRAYSVYGQVDFDITEAVTLSAGARYNDETMEMWAHGVTPPEPVGYGEVNSDRVTPLVSIAYQLDNWNLYAKYSEGFQSGGLSGAVLPDQSIPAFAPEINKAVELGAKMLSPDGRLRFNAAVFHNMITDMQLTVYAIDDDGLPRNFLRNAGEATSQGVELEAQWFPLNGVLLQTSYGYLDITYDEYIDGGINQAENRSVPFAPENTFYALADVRLAETTYGTLRANVDYSYTSEMYSGPPAQLATSGPKYDPSKTIAGDTLIESVGITNARLILSDLPWPGGNGEAELTLWVRNLTDEEHISNYLDFGPGFGELMVAYWMEPRTYGVSFDYSW